MCLYYSRPQSIDMNEKNSQCDGFGGIEAIEFIHNLSARASARSILTRYIQFTGVLKIHIYIWISKAFTFAFLDFQQKLLHASNLERYLFLVISSVNLFFLLLLLGVYV